LILCPFLLCDLSGVIPGAGRQLREMELVGIHVGFYIVDRMKRILLGVLLILATALIWILARSLPPVPITAQFLRWTNYPSGRTVCLLAVTNISTNEVTLLLPMEFRSSPNSSTAAVPTIVWFCPLKFLPQSGRVASFVQTEAHPRKAALHYGERISSVSIIFRVRRWLHLRPGQPRDFLSNPHTLVIDLPPE
jgi:hypothetical protein